MKPVVKKTANPCNLELAYEEEDSIPIAERATFLLSATVNKPHFSPLSSIDELSEVTLGGSDEDDSWVWAEPVSMIEGK